MEIERINIVSHGQEETYHWGERFSAILKQRDVVALYGELGSGKTVFIKGVCSGLNVHDFVTSPSFTLIHEYEGSVKIIHFDFYRLNTEREIADLGFDEYLEKESISLIEWAERGESLLPKECFSIYIERIIENRNVLIDKRSIAISGPAGRGVLNLAL